MGESFYFLSVSVCVCICSELVISPCEIRSSLTSCKILQLEKVAINDALPLKQPDDCIAIMPTY